MGSSVCVCERDRSVTVIVMMTSQFWCTECLLRAGRRLDFTDRGSFSSNDKGDYMIYGPTGTLQRVEGAVNNDTPLGLLDRWTPPL